MRCSAKSGEHLAIAEVARKDFWSYYEAAQRDRLAGKINGVDSLVHVACAADAGGRAFRRYVLPIRLYALDMIQDGFAMPGQINASTRAGRHFKVGLIELIDALIAHPTIEGVLELARRARDESAADPNLLELLDIDGMCGPRIGRPNLWREFQKRNLTRLLGYGRYYRTPVAELDLESGSYRGCGTVLFSAAGGGMSMLGADAREFNRGWFERDQGYVPFTEDEAADSSRNAIGLFGTIQRSPPASMGVFGEKWGCGAEFTHFLELRYDVRSFGFVFDSMQRKSSWCEKSTYNQPELDYAILPGFGAAGELKRLGMGDSVTFEIFYQGMTAQRTHQVALSNSVFDDEQLARETGETFNPNKNPFVRTGLLALLDRGAKADRTNYACRDTELPGWTYPAESGMADFQASA